MSFGMSDMVEWRPTILAIGVGVGLWSSQVHRRHSRMQISSSWDASTASVFAALESIVPMNNGIARRA